MEKSGNVIRTYAAIALLRLGETRALGMCRAYALREVWPLIPLGLAGSQEDASFLLDNLDSASMGPDYLTCLGLLGNVRAVPVLLAHLQSPSLAPAAAQGLWLITGADLKEPVFIPAKFEMDELFEDEREKLAGGDFVPPANMCGCTITRITHDPGTWQTWWEQNSQNFDLALRYRCGKPYAPAVLLELLENPQTPREIHSLAAEELVTRYQIDVPFAVDMFVARQRKALRLLTAEAGALQGCSRPGDWHLWGIAI